MFSIRTHVAPIHQENAMHSILLHFVVKTAEKFSLCSGQYISICFLLLANNILFLCWWATIVGKKCDPRNPVPALFRDKFRKTLRFPEARSFFSNYARNMLTWRGEQGAIHQAEDTIPAPPLFQPTLLFLSIHLRIRNSSPSTVTKSPYGDISGAKRGIINPLVSKQVDTFFWKKLKN